VVGGQRSVVSKYRRKAFVKNQILTFINKKIPYPQSQIPNRKAPSLFEDLGLSRANKSIGSTFQVKSLTLPIIIMFANLIKFLTFIYAKIFSISQDFGGVHRAAKTSNADKRIA